MKEGQLTDLVIRGLHRLSKGGLPLTEIVLNRTRIAHRLTIEDLEVKRFDARNLEVKGPAELRRLVIKDEADLRDAACHHLEVAEIDWPEAREGKRKTYLDGLAYESITTKAEPDKAENWQKLLDWLEIQPVQYPEFPGTGRLFSARRPAKMGRQGLYRRQTPGIGRSGNGGTRPNGSPGSFGAFWPVMAANRGAPFGSVWS